MLRAKPGIIEHCGLLSLAKLTEVADNGHQVVVGPADEDDVHSTTGKL